MSVRSQPQTEIIECPLCLGSGELKRAELLDWLGVKDFARVAQLSAAEDSGGAVRSTIERARAYQAQGLTLRAVGLMTNLAEDSPTVENRTYLAELLAEEGLFDDSAALYLQVVKAGMNAKQKNGS